MSQHVLLFVTVDQYKNGLAILFSSVSRVDICTSGSLSIHNKLKFIITLNFF